MITAALFLLAYLAGALPFGYLVGRARGVNLFQVGSGNIGATNAGRVLGRTYGALVFVLDFFKGVLPVALVVPLARLWTADAIDENFLRVGVAACAFLGHLFPIYLGFRGGKGVATGAGAIVVLVPLPAAVALGTWALAVFATRMVSFASIAALLALVAARLVFKLDSFGAENWLVTVFCIVGSVVVIVKHRTNIARLWIGTESRIGDSAWRHLLLRMLHVLAVGFWFGSGTFFVFVATVPIFDSFADVVKTQPNTRTANVRIVPDGTSDSQRDQLASGLAGAAVGPVFPKFFILSAICAWVAVWTASAWNRGAIGRWRFRICVVAALGVAVGWPLSIYVTELRMLRFAEDPATAQAASAAFGPWHVASLFLSMAVSLLTGVILLLAAKMPDEQAS